MMQQVSDTDIFMNRIASMKANFFLQITQFCIQELSNCIQTLPNENQLANEQIFKQIESLLDPNLRKMFVYDESDNGQKKQLREKQEDSNVKYKKKIKSKIKPQFALHKPKAPTSSYLLFLHENKAEIAAKHKLSNISQVTKAASEEWKQLKQCQKEKYYKKSEEQKAKYKEAIIAYREKYANEIRQDKRRRQSNYKNKWINKKKMEKIEKQKNNQSNNIALVDINCDGSDSDHVIIQQEKKITKMNRTQFQDQSNQQ